MQGEHGTLTFPKLAVCPIKKVWDTAKNVMTYTRAIALRSSYTCAYYVKLMATNIICKIQTSGCKVNANRL